MNVKQIITDYLKAHGCDGLCADGCRYGCELYELGEECFFGITEVCQPAKFVDGKLKPVEDPTRKDAKL